MSKRTCTFIYSLSLAIVLSGLSACGGRSTPVQYQVLGGTNNLGELTQLRSISRNRKDGEISKMRLVQLKDTATVVGAQSGLAWRAKQINAILERQSDKLNNIFNFSAMLMSAHVLPPVLVEAQKTMHLDNTEVLRFADRTYRIQSQAHFVSNPPTWRDYLWMQFAEPEIPNATLLPRNKTERKAWHDFVTAGWEQGIQQANLIYTENLARLKRDYTGMALYRKLLAQHMVSKPYVAHSTLGVTGDKSSIRINDQVLRITALPELSPDSGTWDPILLKRDD